MRTKRSRDARLVDKFNKQRDDKAAESLASRPVRPTADRDDAHGSDREEEDLKVPPGGTVSLVSSQCFHVLYIYLLNQSKKKKCPYHQVKKERLTVQRN